MSESGSDEGSWAPIVVFEDGSESFVYGFQAGRIWEIMSRGDSSFVACVNVSNRVTLERMAMAKDYDMGWEDLGDGCWANASFDKAAPKKGGGLRALGRISVIEGGRAD